MATCQSRPQILQKVPEKRAVCLKDTEGSKLDFLNQRVGGHAPTRSVVRDSLHLRCRDRSRINLMSRHSRARHRDGLSLDVLG